MLSNVVLISLFMAFLGALFGNLVIKNVSRKERCFISLAFMVIIFFGALLSGEIAILIYSFF